MASCNQPSTSCTNSVTTTDGGPISEPRALPMVAVFLPKSKDTGGDKVPPAQWTHLLSGHFEFEFVRGKDVAAGVLTTHKYACFIVGGGLGPQHATEMQKLIGKNKVISYVESGGSYLGLCAGAYVGLNYKPSSEWWTWGLVDASVFDMFNWNRGFGTAKVKLTPAGIKTFPSLTAAARTRC
ncbi:hypothetical protein Pelo_15518 [Pelomyxa schiedti]|nr:hypothetical protein Pelo_15518 [Pelomyxa schiedti]